MDSLDDTWLCLYAESADHFVGVIGGQVKIVVDVVFIEQLPHQELIPCALRFFNQLESKTLDHCLDLIFLDGYLLFWSEVPLIAHIPEEDIVMSEVYVAVIVERNELLFGYLSVSDGKQRNEVILGLLEGPLAQSICLDLIGIEMLHFITTNLRNWLIVREPFLFWSMLSKMC